MSAPDSPRHRAGLTAVHTAMLTGAAIAPAAIKARGYRSITGADLGDLLRCGFADYQCHPPGLLIPGFSLDGRNNRYQFRYDRPRPKADGSTQKYETPAGMRLWLDVPPIVARSRLLGDGDLWITEGIKKADAGASAGLCIVGVIGTYGWKPEDVIRDLLSIPLSHRRVILAFDSDAATKPGVYEPEYRLLGLLIHLGAQVTVVRLPQVPGGEKVGLDDFLATHNRAALDALVARSPIYTWRNPPSPLGSETIGQIAKQQEQMLSLHARVRRNPGVKRLADTAIALATVIASKEPEPDGYTHLWMAAEVAAAAGVPSETASRHLKRLADGGLLDRRMGWVTNKATGEVVRGVFVRLHGGPATFLEAMTRFTPTPEPPKPHRHCHPNERNCPHVEPELTPRQFKDRGVSESDTPDTAPVTFIGHFVNSGSVDTSRINDPPEGFNRCALCGRLTRGELCAACEETLSGRSTDPTVEFGSADPTCDQCDGPTAPHRPTCYECQMRGDA